MMRETCDFDAAFLALNPILNGDFSSWVFHPGMLFGTSRKWWGDFGGRGSDHEGIDFCLFQNPAGAVKRVGHKLLFPAILPGTVVGVIDDLLGKTILLHHPGQGDQGWPLFSLYAHTRISKALSPGDRVGTGDPIASVARPKRTVPGMLAHLHLSMLRMAPGLTWGHLDWSRINRRQGLVLEDPLTWMDCRFTLDEQALRIVQGSA